MPFRNVRGVSKGVQDEEELRKIKEEQKKKKREKSKRWCAMTGLSIVECILCLICMLLANFYYDEIQRFKATYGPIMLSKNKARYIHEPPVPTRIAGVYFALTLVDLVSWVDLRPVSYFAWIMVVTSGFLTFLLYAGCIILSSNSIASYVAIVFGCITALVFLADLICMLLSLKRFPAPYYVLKRKYDKMDECVCTGDYDPEEAEVERPICRCGDHWGEPCTCDDPNLTCGCGVGKHQEPPCECCECGAQAIVSEDTEAARAPSVAELRQSMVSTLSGRDTIDETRRSTFVEAALPMDDLFCSRMTPGRYCIDAYPQSAASSLRSTFLRQSAYSDPYEDQVPRKSTIITASQPSDSRKSAFSTKASMIARPSMAARSSMAARPSMASSPSRRFTTTSSRLRGVEPPTLDDAVRMGEMHRVLSTAIGTPSMTVASRLQINKSRKSMAGPRKSSQMAYSVYTTTVDDKAAVEKSFNSKYDAKKRKMSVLWDRDAEQSPSKSSSEDEEIGEGDYTTRVQYTNVGHHQSRQQSQLKKSKLRFSTLTVKPNVSDIAYMSDPEMNQSLRATPLPGQVSSFDDADTDRYNRKKNVSVSARERSSRRSTNSMQRPMSEQTAPRHPIEEIGAPRLIRNVSTTVRAVRTLSRVIEVDSESRTDNNDGFSSERTFTLRK